MKQNINILRTYLGGQVEIIDCGNDVFLLGKLKEIEVSDSTLKLKFNWLAEKSWLPPNNQNWIKSEKLNYEVDLKKNSESFLLDHCGVCVLRLHSGMMFFVPSESPLIVEPSKIIGL